MLHSYPEFPVCNQRVSKAPKLPKTNSVVQYDLVNGAAVFDDGEESTIDADSENSSNVPGCPDRHDSELTTTTITIDDVVGSSDYPTAYNLQETAWAINYLSFDPLSNLQLRILPLGGKQCSNQV